MIILFKTIKTWLLSGNIRYIGIFRSKNLKPRFLPLKKQQNHDYKPLRY